jgi:hypothetical protein
VQPPPALSDTEADLLSYLVDDHYGLWEVVGILSGDRPRARALLEDLLARGWIELFTRSGSGQFLPLPVPEIAGRMASDAAWQLAPDACWVTTTFAGDAVYEAIPTEFWARLRLGG